MRCFFKDPVGFLGFSPPTQQEEREDDFQSLFESMIPPSPGALKCAEKFKNLLDCCCGGEQRQPRVKITPIKAVDKAPSWPGATPNTPGAGEGGCCLSEPHLSQFHHHLLSGRGLLPKALLAASQGGMKSQKNGILGSKKMPLPQKK